MCHSFVFFGLKCRAESKKKTTTTNKTAFILSAMATWTKYDFKNTMRHEESNKTNMATTL